MSAEDKAVLALDYEEAFAAAQPKGAPVGNQNASRSETTESPTGETTGQKIVPLSKDKVERKSAARAAKAVGANREYVRQAKAVRRDAPDLEAQVRAKEMPLRDAYKQARARTAAMPKPEPVAKPTAVMLTLRTNYCTPKRVSS